MNNSRWLKCNVHFLRTTLFYMPLWHNIQTLQKVSETETVDCHKCLGLHWSQCIHWSTYQENCESKDNCTIYDPVCALLQ